MKTKKIVNGYGLVMLMIVTIMSVTAWAKGDSRGRGGEQGPPPEAIKACEGKQDGETVSFKGRRGESLSATCQSINGQLVAVPEGHKRK